MGTPPERSPQKYGPGHSADTRVAEPVAFPRTANANGPGDTVRSPSGRRERRLAAIAFLDVVGFSSIVEMDEEGTLERWRNIRERMIRPRAIEHQGRIVERLGDGLVLEFPNAVDAMRWALDVQERLAASTTAEPPIRVRIAIHVSDILVEDDRLFGDGVNIAARLQEYADPGGVAFSAVVHEQVRDVLRYEAVDLGPLQLKNIGRMVRAFAVPGVGPAEARSPAALPSHRPSIAVLPLRSLGPCPVEEYFAEGITHDVVASLAGFRELFVVSSTSTLGLAGEGAAAVKAGQALGVRYVLNGTVSRRDDRLRITVELTDIETRSVVWTDRYDTSAADLFAAQDAAATRIAYSLLPHLRQSELQRAQRKPPGKQDAYDLVLQAMHRLYRFGDSDYRASHLLLQRAIERDPTYALAYTLLAQWHVFNVGEGRSSDIVHDGQEAARLTTLALQHDPTDPLALAVFGHTRSFLFSDFDRALDAFDRALASSPNSAIAWGLSSPTFAYLGNGPTAVARAEFALRLSPLDPYVGYYHHILCLAHYANNAYKEAVQCGRRAMAMNERFAGGLRPLAAALIATGLEAEARQVAAAVLKAEPNFTVEGFAAWYPMRDTAKKAAFVERLLAAGLPLRNPLADIG